MLSLQPQLHMPEIRPLKTPQDGFDEVSTANGSHTKKEMGKGINEAISCQQQRGEIVYLKQKTN